MRPIRWLRRGMTLLTISATGAAAAVTIRHLLDTPQPLESGLPGEGHIDRKPGGSMYYNTAGAADAAPMVLLHDFYPGASNYEYRRVFPRFATEFRVYAPDWLGFGMSEHPHVAYTGEFYANVLADFLRGVVKRPARVVASGRAANIAVRTAADAPELFTSQVLISPYALAGVELDPTLGQALARAAQRASLGLVPYAVLSTRPALRRLADARTAHRDDPEAREAAIRHLYASAHQFGGHHALLALLSGELDLPMQNTLALMEPPALIVSGGDDPEHPREEMEELAILSPHADLEVIPGAGAAVMEDQPAAFVEVVTRWLRRERPRQVAADNALLAEADAEEPPSGAGSSVPTGATTPASGAELLERTPAPAEATITVPVQTPPTEPATPAAPGDVAPTPEAAPAAPGDAAPAPPFMANGTEASSAPAEAAQPAPRAARGATSQPRGSGGRNSRPLDKSRGQAGGRQGGTRTEESRAASSRHEREGEQEGTGRGSGRRRGERRNGRS